MRRTLFFVGVVLAVGATHSQSDDRVPPSPRDEIRRLAVQRLRSAPDDMDRVLVAGENRIRARYHTAAGEAPAVEPPGLKAELDEFRRACQKTHRAATRGETIPPDDTAQQWVEDKWAVYRSRFAALLEDLNSQKANGVGESRIYWEALQAFDKLKMHITADVLFNGPVGGPGLEAVLRRDETALLIACELPPKKTRARHPTVVFPTEKSGRGLVDVQAFYRSQDKVPDKNPVMLGTWVVPVGARTVTRRESGLALVIRPRSGLGVAYVGQTEEEIRYGYMLMAPGTPFYFENIGDEPLEIDFVGIK